MRTKKGMQSLISKIMDYGSLENDDFVNDMETLKNAIDEMETYVSSKAKNYDPELDEYDFEEMETTPEGPSEWESKYHDLEKKYKDRFFGTDTDDSDGETTIEDIIEDQEKDIEKDSEDLTFDDLLYKTEG